MCIVCALAEPTRFQDLLPPHDFTDLDSSASSFSIDASPVDSSTLVFADVPDDSTTSTVLVPGGNYQGEIETVDDVDWIKVTLTAGETYNFSVEGRANWGRWTLEDTNLELLDAEGNVIASDTDSGWVYDAQLFFTADTSGDYFLAVSHGTVGSATGTYEIESEIITNDPGADIASALTISPDTTTRAAIETPADADWFALSVEDGKSYLITAQGVLSGDANSLSDNQITIYDGAGNIVFSATDGANSRDASIEFEATSDTTYYISVEGQNNEIGTYGLNVVEINNFTNDQIATQLTDTYWGGRQRAWDLSGGRQITVDITGLDALGQETARYSLNAWTDVLGIEFIEVTSGAQLTFDDEVIGRAYAGSSVSNGVIYSSNINVGKGWSGVTTFGENNYLTQTYIHEIGHSLGLGHGGNYNGAATYGEDNDYSNDSWQATVMSYFSQNDNTTVDASFAYVATPQLADIIAARSLYGSIGQTRTDDTIYGFGNNTGNALFDHTQTNVSYTIVDDGGIDTIAAGSGFNAIISLIAETFSSLNGESNNIAIARGVVIENATGSDGNDILIGNRANNVLIGNEGDDTFWGNGGLDEIDGGAGTDVLNLSGTAYTDYTVVSIGTDAFLILDMNMADGDDGIIVSQGVENYALDGVAAAALTETDTGTMNVVDGDSSSNELSGSVAQDILVGYGDNDILFGLDNDDILVGGAGDDTLIGGLGADILLGGDGFDTVSYAGAASGITASLFTGVGSSDEAAGDAFVGIEALRGSDFNDVLVGRDGASDSLFGGQGSDGLRGNGGDDFLYGEGGNDLFFSGFGADSHIGGAGTDTILYNQAGSGVIVYLDTGQGFLGQAEGDTYDSIENVVGSAFTDLIVGSSGANTLQGRDGDDTLNGGDGGDLLNGGNGFDTVTYATSDARVVASLFTGVGIGADAQGDSYVDVEALTGSAFNDLLIGRDGASDTLRGGDGSDGLRGNGGDDMLYGEGGNDLLFSGFGADHHDGGAGTDTIVFDQAGAGVIVNLSAGTGAIGQAAGDTYTSIENVVGTAFGDFVVGDAVANNLQGRAGNDVLDGRGGSDVLIGGNNADRFIFDAGYGTDRVEDFTRADGDIIDVRGFGFTDFAQVQALMFDDDGDAVINFGDGDALRLVGVDMNTLTANDFLLADSSTAKPQPEEQDKVATLSEDAFSTPEDVFFGLDPLAEVFISATEDAVSYITDDAELFDLIPDDMSYDFA